MGISCQIANKKLPGSRWGKRCYLKALSEYANPCNSSMVSSEHYSHAPSRPCLSASLQGSRNVDITDVPEAGSDLRDGVVAFDWHLALERSDRTSEPHCGHWTVFTSSVGSA